MILITEIRPIVCKLRELLTKHNYVCMNTIGLTSRVTKICVNNVYNAEQV